MVPNLKVHDAFETRKNGMEQEQRRKIAITSVISIAEIRS